MKKALLIMLLFTIPVLAERVTKTYDYTDFTAVSAGWGMKVKISQSDKYSIEVKADERDMKYLKVEKSGDGIEFSIDRNNYRKKGNIFVTITMPKLTELGLSGGSECKLKMDVHSNDFRADLSGGSSIEGDLKCADLSLELSGGSEVNISGSGKDLKMGGSGGSEIHLKDFAVNNVDANLSGGSEAQVKMNGKLDTDQSGGSELTYYGKAILGDVDFSGGSSAKNGDED